MSQHPRFDRKASNSLSRQLKLKGLRRRFNRQETRALRPRLELMEDRTLLATMLWAISTDGDWNVVNNWVNSANSSDHHVPTSSDNAQINVTGITVTHSSSTSDAARSLTSQSTVQITGGSLAL